MGLIAHWWLCPTCRCTSGKAGHIGCTGPDGKPQPAPMELVPAATYQGAVSALRYLAHGLESRDDGSVVVVPGAINREGLAEARAHLRGQ